MLVSHAKNTKLYLGPLKTQLSHTRTISLVLFIAVIYQLLVPQVCLDKPLLLFLHTDNFILELFNVVT